MRCFKAMLSCKSFFHMDTLGLPGCYLAAEGSGDRVLPPMASTVLHKLLLHTPVISN